VRSAVYGAAEPSERRAAHQALAEATDPRVDPDRRAWHRAQAAPLPDEDLAAELEQSAARAQARGGFAAAGAFLERAAALTPDPVRRAGRALTAAQTTFRSGALEETLRLLSAIEVGALDELESARVGLVRAQVAFVSTHGSEAPALLLQAARRLTPLAPTLACETYLEALSAAMFAGRLAAEGASTLDVSLAAMAAPRPTILGGPELLLDGLATFFSQSYAAAVPILRRAERAFDVSGMSVSEQLRWKWLATVAAIHLWDDARWEAIAERHVQIAREAGALAELPLALNMRAYSHLFAGDLSAAESLVDEIRAACDATGSNLAPYGAVGLAALRGRPDAIAFIDDSRSDVARRGEGIGLSVLDWAQAVLYNGLGRYEEARAAALRATELPHNLSSSNWGMAELVEAAARSGSPDLAADACSRMTEMSVVTGTAWARGVAARSQALLANDDTSEALFREAVQHLGQSRMGVDLARTHLLFGEWLRRHRRRIEAREHLRAAHERFSDFGMEAFADRARVELEATGEHARKRTQDTLDHLTPQEAQISRLVAQGNTNRQVAAHLFISPSTVEYHLRKAFRKLGVTSRTQLAHRLQG
jgi:DNA-binding CsgD family transcriptional regulator